MTSSIYITIIVALERYSAVSKPLSTYVADTENGWRSVIACIAPVVALITIFNVPEFFEFRVETIYYECINGCQEDELNFTTYSQWEIANLTDTTNPQVASVRKIYPTNLRIDSSYIKYYKTLAETMVTGFIPLISLIVLNYIVYKRLKKKHSQSIWSKSGMLFKFMLIPKCFVYKN